MKRRPSQSPDEDARFAALEWMLIRLATSYCLRQPDPVDTAERIHDEGVAHSRSIATSAACDESTRPTPLVVETAEAILSLTTSIRELVAVELPAGS